MAEGGKPRWDEKYRARAQAGKVTPIEIKTWVAKAKPGESLPFGGNLQLEVSKSGTALWRTYYRIHDPEKGRLVERTFSHGPFNTARGYAQVKPEHDQVKAQAREGTDPVKARYVQYERSVSAGEDTFEAIAREWLANRKKWSGVHRTKSVRALERDVFPYIGRLPVGEITPAMVAKVIERIAKRGISDTPAKILQHVTRIFALAQTKAHGAITQNPALPAREVLPERAKRNRYPALLKWAELGEILRKADAAKLSPSVRMAHRLCAFTVARVGNVVTVDWREFALDAEPPQWVIPRAQMKAQDRHHDHRIILGTTIAAELREWRKKGSGKGYAFPSPAGGKHITRESLEKLYRVTLGLEGKHTPHGWRSSLSTLARDEGGFDRDAVELALDHIHDSDVVRAYDRGERLEQRIKLMNWWDAELTRAQRGAEVVPLSSKRA